MIVKLATGLVAWAVCLAGGADAQPRSHAARAQAAPAHAKPSLEGRWGANFIMPLEATPETPKLVVSEDEARAITPAVARAFAAFFVRALDPEVPMLVERSDGLPIVRGERRTRLVVLPADGKAPFTPAARKALTSPPPPESYDNPEQRPNAERCLVGAGQPPLASVTLGDQLQILQFPDKVVLHTEYGDDLRVVPITDKHAPKGLWSRLGDSIARWEGATLVIETIGMPAGDSFRIGPVMLVPGDATVIERLTPVSRRELLYQFTVIDPKTYAAPWMGEFSWYRTDKQMYEHACHEGNYSLPNILGAARYLEASARATTSASR
jgi:hypothetical protein